MIKNPTMMLRRIQVEEYERLQESLTEVLNTVKVGEYATELIFNELSNDSRFNDSISKEHEMYYTLDDTLAVLFELLDNYIDYNDWSDDDISELECLYSEIHSFITETLDLYCRFPAM